jgi:predicted PhzF superfamily epimerase YddE/YHI9
MKMYHVDSFTDTLFKGNPAGVCLLGEEWLPEETMQNIAMENNMSETAFVVYKNGEKNVERSIRWFTPVSEVPLCGHATLAAAHVLFNHEHIRETHLVFQSGRGELYVDRENDLLVLDFPRDTIWEIPMTDALDCFNYKPISVYRGTSEYLLIFENEDAVRNAVCNLQKASVIDLHGFIITAKANTRDIDSWRGFHTPPFRANQKGMKHESNTIKEQHTSSLQGEVVDFVSRYFSPKYGLDEDPVTGSAHTLLVPYWQSVMNKDSFFALQVSQRGGSLYCSAVSDRVRIGGKAVTYLIGEIFL